MEIQSPKALEATGPNSRCQQSHAPCQISQAENPFLAFSSFQWLPPSSANSGITGTSASVFRSPVCLGLCFLLYVSHTKTLVIGCGDTQLIQDDLISKCLTTFHLQRPIFQIKSQSPCVGTKWVDMSLSGGHHPASHNVCSWQSLSKAGGNGPSSICDKEHLENNKTNKTKQKTLSINLNDERLDVTP